MNMEKEILPHEKDKLKCILCCGFYALNRMTIVDDRQYCHHCVPNEYKSGC